MMFITPFTFFWLLLAGGGVAVVLYRLRVRFVDELAAAVTGLTSLAWLLLRARLPLAGEVAAWPAGSTLPTWNWRLDEVAWQLSIWLLLLVAGGLLVRSGFKLAKKPMAGGQEGVEPDIADGPVAAFALWLTAAALVVIWADSIAAIMTGWMLFMLAWGTALIVFGSKDGEDVSRTFRGVGWLLLSLGFLWLAAAHLPYEDTHSLDMGNWPIVPTSSVLTAALLQMGVWPVSGWRLKDRHFTPLLEALLHIVPALAGASLLYRLVATSDISMGYSLFLTSFSLLGVVLALYRTWGYLHAPAQMVANLALAQTSLVLLVGVWAGPTALLAEARVMALAVGILFLVIGGPSERVGWGRTLSAGFAVAAVAGTPLTAGFVGRSTLYNAWIADGRPLLLLVTVLMHIPLITVVLVRCWPRRYQNSAETELPAMQARLIMAAGLLLPALGLLSLAQIFASAVRLGAWLAVILPAAASLALFRYLGDLRETRQVVYRAFALSLTNSDSIGRLWRSFLQNSSAMVREAAAILEGEGGMLWLLVLVVVFFLVG